MSAPPRTQPWQRVHLRALGARAGKWGAGCPPALLQRAVSASTDAQRRRWDRGGLLWGTGEVSGSEYFLGCLLTLCPGVGGQRCLRGTSCPRKAGRAPIRYCPRYAGQQQLSCTADTWWAGFPPLPTGTCASLGRDTKTVLGQKMLEAGPDPLHYTPRCLWGQWQWRGSNPPYRSPAWQIRTGRARRAGVSAARCSPGHIPEGCVWPAVH